MLRSSSSAKNGWDPTERAKYARDPWAYLHDILHIRQLTEDQNRLLEAVVNGPRTLSTAANAVGKCLESRSLIPLADGRRVKAADLVGQEFQLLTLDDKGCIVAADARAEWNRIEDVYEVTTESGRRVIANAQHPLYAADYLGRNGKPSAAPVGNIGWRAVRDLSVGDVVAVPTELPAFGREEQEPGLVKVAAYLTAEGYMGNRVEFSQAHGVVLDDYRDALDSLGQGWSEGLQPNRAPSIYFQWSSPLGQQLEALGMRGLDSHSKAIPDFVWRLPRHQLALFVNRLWAGDGCFWTTPPSAKSKNGSGHAEYTSVSEQLARDVQHALLRLGISSKLRKRKTAYVKPDGEKREGEAWVVAVHDAENLVRFDDVVGPVLGKEAAQAQVAALARAITGKRKSRRYIPWRDYGLPASLRWEKVVSIEPKGQKMTVAIEVPGYHTYLTDLYEHNTHLLGAIGVWWQDAVGSQPDEEEDGRCQGALWLMTAPDAETVHKTVWARGLEHIKRAIRNGHPMPGEFSDKSVLWRIRAEDWHIEKLSPPQRVGQEQQHGASGRHHKNLLITIDEGPGVDAARYRAAEGMASGATNKIVVVGNPTEPIGPYAERAESGEYTVVRISSLNHPNVVERREVIPGGAISHVTIDRMISKQCLDRGEYVPGKNEPDPAFFDFLYRLHPWVGSDKQDQIPDPLPTVDEVVIVGEQEYRVLGHRDAPLHVFRPDNRFLSSRMGIFPLESQDGLFPAPFINRMFERWQAMAKNGEISALERERRGYDRVGLDPAEEGGDVPLAYPMWRVGDLAVFDYPKDLRRGLDREIAAQAYHLFGSKPEYIVDVIGVGTGVGTRLDDAGCKVERFKGSETAYNDEDEGEPPFVNKRAAAYWRASILVKQGKVAVPADAELKEELLAIKAEYRNGKLLIVSKKKLREILGRSPNKADAFVQALWDEREKAEAGGAYIPIGGRRPQPPKDYSMYAKEAA